MVLGCCPDPSKFPHSHLCLHWTQLQFQQLYVYQLHFFPAVSCWFLCLLVVDVLPRSKIVWSGIVKKKICSLLLAIGPNAEMDLFFGCHWGKITEKVSTKGHLFVFFIGELLWGLDKLWHKACNPTMGVTAPQVKQSSQPHPPDSLNLLCLKECQFLRISVCFHLGAGKTWKNDNSSALIHQLSHSAHRKEVAFSFSK